MSANDRPHRDDSTTRNRRSPGQRFRRASEPLISAQTLLDQGASLSGSLGYQSALRDFVERLRVALDLRMAAVLGSSSARRLDIVAEAGMKRRPEIDFGRELMYRVGQEPGGLAFVGDRHGKLGRDLLEYLDSAGCEVHNGLALALVGCDGPEGVVLVGREHGSHFEEHEVELLTRLVAGLSSTAEGVEAQRELVARERKFRTLMRSAIDPILLCDPKTHEVVEMNRAAGELFGLVADNRRPQRMQEGLVQYLESLRISEDISKRSEHRIAGPDGERFFEARAREVTLGGRGLYLISARDTTDRRRLEAELEASKRSAEEAEQAASRFLATMSHEIRTPLGGLIGMAELLLESDLSPQQRDSAATICSSAEALLEIVNGVLDLSKLEAGKVELESRPVEPAGIMREIVELMSELAREKGLTLRSRSDGEFPADLRGDPLRIRQVLINLVTNAVKFTDSGHVELRARISAKAPGEVTVRFEVEDSGIGIEPGTLAYLFKRYRQADRSTSRRFGGTGLGLAISRELVELQRGRIDVTSEVGRGSCFWFELPLRLGAGVAGGAESTDGAPAPALPGGGAGSAAEEDADALDVLVVEDNPVNRKVTSRFLEKLGHRVVLAEHGREALERLDEQRFDVILMDCQMPVMDGYEAVLELRSRERSGSLRPTPVIALTANVRESDRQRCFEVGMDAYLNKPVRLAELSDAIEAAAGRSKGAAR